MEAEKFYAQLINPEEEIGLRYQAVFQLKNINSEEAIKKLVDAYPHLA
jgi:HEAT repeat protein